MKKFTLNIFWLFLFITMLFVFTTYALISYSIEHDRSLRNQQENLLIHCHVLKYNLSIMIEKEGLEGIMESVDAKALLNSKFKSLSIIQNNKIIISSNKNYIAKNKSEFDYIEYEQLKTLKYFDFYKAVNINLDSLQNPELKNNLSVLIELYKVTGVDSMLRYHILFTITISLIMLFITVFLFHTFIINPIRLINSKINNHNLTYSDFPLSDLNTIDKNLVDSIQTLYKTQKEIKEQSYVDELTKLYNRKSYNERLTEFFSLYHRYGTKFSILMYDIDDFKTINDTYGHSVGDKVLIQMSQLVQSLIRENDYLFRIGGEEFIILFSETNLSEAKVVAIKIRKSVEALNIIENKKITISIGLSEVKKEDNEDLIFKRVDGLLYHSKRNGKNQITTEEDIKDET